MQQLNQVVPQYNKIPSDSPLVTSIKPLGKNDSVTYRIIGAYDPARPKFFGGRTLVLPPTDTVQCPKYDEPFDIAYIKSIGEGGVPVIGEIIFKDNEGSRLTLYGNRVDHQKMYRYIEMCNYLVDNPFRDISKEAKIERESLEKDRQIKRTKRQVKEAAYKLIESMSESEVLDFIRANRLPDTGSHDSRVQYLEDLAETDPMIFAKGVATSEVNIDKMIDEAEEAKIIVYDKVKREWQLSDGKRIIAVKKGFNINPKNELSGFLFQPDGHQFLDIIKSELSK
jgi:hypothetical protein